MTVPQRIQLRRTKGWRKPAGTIVVSRPTRWGIAILLPPGRHADAADRAAVVASFRTLLEADSGSEYPSLDEIRTELAGHDLACWCPLDHPCHADVLLEVANRGPGGPALG